MCASLRKNPLSHIVKIKIVRTELSLLTTLQLDMAIRSEACTNILTVVPLQKKDVHNIGWSSVINSHGYVASLCRDWWEGGVHAMERVRVEEYQQADTLAHPHFSQIHCDLTRSSLAGKNKTTRSDSSDHFAMFLVVCNYISLLCLARCDLGILPVLTAL